MSAHRFAVCLLTTLAVGRIAAADPDDMRFQDLRLQVGLPPASARVTASQVGDSSLDAKAREDVTWAKRGRWSLQWVPNIHPITPEGEGFFLLELNSERFISEAAGNGDQLSARAVTLGAHIGLAWVLFTHTTLELGGFGALGTAWQEPVVNHGLATELGGRVALTWSPGATHFGRPLIGAALLLSETHLESQGELSGRTYDVVIDARGFTPALTVGWRF